MTPGLILVAALAATTSAGGSAFGRHAAFAPFAPVAASSPGLSAAAAASGRPAECSSGSKRALARGPSVWERARVPALQHYCDLVARAQAQLASSPEAAKKAAEEAEAALPGRAAPQVLLGRSLLALGMTAEAAGAFARAKAIDARSVEEPATLHAYARVLVRTGKREEGLTVYRALVPRADLIGSPSERITVLLEAADASMADASGKPPRLDEAIAYLREARQRSATELEGAVDLMLALTLDRAGDGAQAAAALTEAERTGARVPPNAFAFFAAPEDALALDALAHEATDRAAAQKAWESFLAGAGGKGPWAAQARARLELIKRGGGARAPKKP